MKQKRLLRFFALLLAAALLGWLLPSAVFRIGDSLEEGKTSEVQIRQIDLSFQSDLDTASRLRLVHGSVVDNATPLERGIYLQQQDAEDISARFLRELTGERIPAEAYADTTPMLFNFSGEGTILVWVVHADLGEEWFWEAIIDDQTGIILRCSFQGGAWNWPALFPDYDGEVPVVEEYVSSRLSDALRSHYNQRLGTALRSDVQQAVNNYFEYSAELVLSQEQEEYRIPLVISFDPSAILLN